MAGNERFLTGKTISPGRTPADFSSMAAHQAPKAIIVGCSDSRVPPEIVFDQGVGDLFIIRVAGNLVHPAEAGVIGSQDVLVAVAVDEDGRRQILAVELANRESRSSWREFLAGLKARGLAGVEFVVSDNHEGLKAAIREVLSEAAWQRC